MLTTQRQPPHKPGSRHQRLLGAANASPHGLNDLAGQVKEGQTGTKNAPEIDILIAGAQ